MPEGAGLEVVPEPEVKRSLAELGVAVPRSVSAPDPGTLARAAVQLPGPLVLKAWGPGIVHKTDLGAVAVGVAHDEVEEAARSMAARLAGAGIVPEGFFVEELVPAGVDVLVGVVRRPHFGLAVALGFGGELAEVVDEVVLRLHPLTEGDARGLVAAWRGARLLAGFRGQPPADVEALVAVVLAIAGPGGLADRVGPGLAELECNPVRVLEKGAVALDARLLLSPAGSGSDTDTDTGAGTVGHGGPSLDRLFAPRSVAIVGASASGKASFGTRALQAYKDLGWTEGLYTVHPQATEIDGVPARPSLAGLPEPVDYALVALPAAQCAGVLAGAAGRVGFVHVVSGGFSEVGGDGPALQAELVAAVRDIGARLLGPNCMGVYSPRGRHAFQLGVPREAGRVAVVSQSGGLSGDVIKTGYARGLRFSAVVSLGNAADVTPGELLEHLAARADTGVVGLYVEGGGVDDRLVPALRAIAGRVPAVLLVGGRSEQGAAAAASHTGALAGDGRLWDAVAAATGVAVVDTLEDFLGVLLFHQAYGTGATEAAAGGVPAVAGGSPSVLVVGAGGGASVLSTDACERAGLRAARIGPELQAELRGMGYGVGMSVANPMEVAGGPSAPPDVFHRLIGPVLAAQPYDDVLLHLNAQSYISFGGDGLAVLRQTLGLLAPDTWPGTRVTVVLRNLDAVPADEAGAAQEEAVAAGVPAYRTFDEAAVAIAAGQQFAAAAGQRFAAARERSPA